MIYLVSTEYPCQGKARNNNNDNNSNSKNNKQ